MTLSDRDYRAIESLIEEYYANNKQPDHKGNRPGFFVNLLETLKEHGFGEDFVSYSSGSKTVWALIMSKAFNSGPKALTPRQRGLRENIIKDLKTAIALHQKEYNLANASREAPKEETIPDIQVQEPVVEAKPEEAKPEEAKPVEEVKPAEPPKEFKSASEANAALNQFKTAPDPSNDLEEPVFDERWSLVLGITKEDK